MQYTAPAQLTKHPEFKSEYVTLLWYALASIPDTRGPQGVEYSLPVLITIAICALCCGADGYEAIAQWCHDYQDEIREYAPCIANQFPVATTFARMFRSLHLVATEQVFSDWVKTCVVLACGAGIALDGKTTMRDGIHLVSTFAHTVKAVLFQSATDTKGKEIPTRNVVLAHTEIAGHVITADALHAQHDFCETITNAGGGYVVTVKENQKQLYTSLVELFTTPPWGSSFETTTRTEKSHGRVETRTVCMSAALNDYLSDWAGLTHVFEYIRERTYKGATTRECAYGIARLLPHFSTAKHLADYVRDHWSIENHLHRERDVVLHEDASPIRSVQGAHGMAILRNIANTIFHQQSNYSFPALRRHFAAHPKELFSLFGLHTKTTVICT